MPDQPAFEVHPGFQRLSLDANRTARATFMVANRSGRQLRCLVRVLPQQPGQLGWYTLEGDAEQVMEAGAERSVVLALAVPASAAAGAYTFRVLAVGTENPDEYSGESDPVGFEVGAPPLGRPGGKGYLVTFAGAVAGGAVGSLVGTLPGSLFLISQVHVSAGKSFGEALGQTIATVIGALILFVLGMLIGLWAGPVLGAFIALKIRGYAGAGWTAALLAVFAPIWTVIAWIAVLAAFSATKSSLFGIAVLLAVVVSLAVPPWPARAIVVLRTSGHV